MIDVSNGDLELAVGVAQYADETDLFLEFDPRAATLDQAIEILFWQARECSNCHGASDERVFMPGLRKAYRKLRKAITRHPLTDDQAEELRGAESMYECSKGER